MKLIYLFRNGFKIRLRPNLGFGFWLQRNRTNVHKHFKDKLGITHFHIVAGPSFSFLRLSVCQPSVGWRLIFYWPSGKWWNFDFVVDRRLL